MNDGRLGDTLVSAGLVAAVVPAILPIFGGGGLLALLVAAAAPAALALALAGGSAWLRLAANVAVALTTIGRLPPSSDGRSALRGLLSGVPRLATAAVPLQAAVPELAVVVAPGRPDRLAR